MIKIWLMHDAVSHYSVMLCTFITPAIKRHLIFIWTDAKE